MFTINDYAVKAMAYAYRDMRRAGQLDGKDTSGTPLTQSENDDLFMFITIELARMVNRQAGFAMHLVPLIESLAFAIAMTEQYEIGSDRYCAWRDYENELLRRALNANR